MPSLLHSPFVKVRPRFRLLFGSRGVIHPTRELKSPYHSSRALAQTERRVLVSAGEFLDAVERDWSTTRMLWGDGRAAFHERWGSDL